MLHALADRAGILPGYVDCAGVHHATTDTARQALLAAMGFDGSSEFAAQSTLHDLGERGPQAPPIESAQCLTIAEKTGSPVFGIWCNLYSLRGAAEYGIGDFGALRELVDYAADVGASFVGVNPLHATRNQYPDISPYRAMTRLFGNPIYIDITAVPEWAEYTRASANTDTPRGGPGAQVDYDAVWAAKSAVLRDLHAMFVRFHTRGVAACGQSYAAFLSEQGKKLRDFATFVVLDEYCRRQRGIDDWRDWSREFRKPDGPALVEFQRRYATEIDFQCHLQFELDVQLRGVAELAAHGGMPIGLFKDLAVGTAPNGADPWLYPDLFVHGASIGAPPDELAPQGQNWGLAPLNPFRWEQSGYQYWVDVLRHAFAHAGALRIDHVMGLQRQFWIPDGYDGKDGAYVSFPADDLFAILAAESRRHNAIVIGEDLGTVPHGFADALARWGILSTRVLYFERDHAGEFKAAGEYLDRALATANTHDLPSLAAFWSAADIELRRKVGLLRTDADFDAAMRQREFDRAALLRRLSAEGLWQGGSVAVSHDFVAAVYQMLSRSPAPLVGVSLDDVVLETGAANLPGVGPDRFPSWTRRMSSSLTELRASPDVAGVWAGLQERAFRTKANGG
jgi:4-alpha-glucanotransferase